MILGLIAVYGIIVIVRIVLYVKLVMGCENTEADHLHFGMFLGNFMDSKGWAIFFTLCIMLLIIACFILSFFSFRFLTEVDEIHTKRERRSSSKGA